jgi:hydrogenase maturation protease
MDPVKVLRLAEALGGQVRRLLVVGCEPAPPAGSDDTFEGMSEPVRAAVGDAALLVESLAGRLLRGEGIETEAGRGPMVPEGG